MEKTVPYLRWRRAVERRTPPDCRIGDDLLLLRQPRPDMEFETGPFRLDMTLAIYLRQGSCRVMIDMVEYTATAPCMVVVMAGQLFLLVTLSGDMESLTMLMSEAFAAGLFGARGPAVLLQRAIRRSPVVGLAGDAAPFETYLALLENLVHSPLRTFRLEAARHLTLSMFYGYSYRLHDVDGAERPRTKQEELCRRFEEELRTHYIRERQVAFYAGRLCVTPKYLSAVVRQQTGRTAQARIETYVVTESKALLLSTDLSVQQIADRLNFPSQSVFGKYFKRATGLSPRAFRNRMS